MRVALGDGCGVVAVAAPVVPVAVGRGETLALGRGATLALGRTVGRTVEPTVGRTVGRTVTVGRRVVAGRGVAVGAGRPGMTRVSPALERPESRIG